ncbi:MAG: hypothetical protein M1833_006696 [Piccolia ochrophora]|nr:MAG: hypothetical protein M1833_006696 [Piccolia ochrophora]
MADWRDRGFVPDSDDDDDIADELESSPTTPTLADAPAVYYTASQERSQRLDACVTEPTTGTRSPLDDQVDVHDNDLTSAALLRFDRSTNDVPNNQINGGAGESEDAERLSQNMELTKEPQDRSFPNGLLHVGPFAVTVQPDFQSTSPIALSASSPLTELPSTPMTIYSGVSNDLNGTEHGESPVSSNERPANPVTEDLHLDLSDVEETNNDHGRMRAGRALRKRNPIQLHPYMLEGERYRLSLKARGLKPLRLEQARREASMASGMRNDDHDNAYEDVARLNDEDTQQLWSSQDFAPPSQREDSPASEDELTTLSAPRHPSYADEEFPDVSLLFRSSRPGRISAGNKRRKTNHGDTRTTEKRYSSMKSGSGLGTPEGGSATVPSLHNTYANPPSPPLSKVSSSFAPQDRPAQQFRRPRGLSPDLANVLPRPSTPQNLDAGGMPSDETTDPENRTSFLGEPETLSSGQSPSPTPHISRTPKTKRVIPASWLMLDDRKSMFKSGKLPSRRHALSGHPAQDPTRPGLARRKSPTTGSEQTTGDVLRTQADLSEETESPDDDSSPHLTESSNRKDQGIVVFDRVTSPGVDFGEVAEDNRVDEMIPARALHRAKRKGTASKKRQRRLTEFKDGYHAESSRRNAQSSTMPPRPLMSSISKRRTDVRRKQSPPSLSILDALSQVKPGDASLPSFIKIAGRRARGQPHNGRHSPTRKLFRLHNRSDTQDVQSLIHEWRGGNPSALVGNTDPKTIARQPLQERNGNELGVIRERKQVGPRTRYLGTQRPRMRTSTGYKHSTRPAHDGSNRVDSHTAATHGQNPRARRDDPEKAKQRSQYILPWHTKDVVPYPAQLESTTTKFRHRNPLRHPKYRPFDLLRRRQDGTTPQQQTLQLERYFADEGQTPVNTAWQQTRSLEVESTNPHPSKGREATSSIKRPRKRKPRHIDADTIEYRQPEDDIVLAFRSSSAPVESHSNERDSLQGLGPFGTTYTTTFDTLPLKMGTYFHESTFIGNGQLSKALAAGTQRDYTSLAGYTVIRLRNQHYRWREWKESVSAELGECFDFITVEIEGNDYHSAESGLEPNIHTPLVSLPMVLQSIVEYVNDVLIFTDPIDRTKFVRRLSQLLQQTLNAFVNQLGLERSLKGKDTATRRLYVACLTRLLLLAHQSLQLGTAHAPGNQHVEQDEVTSCERLIVEISQQLIKCLVRAGFESIRCFYEENQRLVRREGGIREDEYLVTAWVAIMHVLSRARICGVSFWGLLNSELGLPPVKEARHLRQFEHLWTSVFTLLPLQEINEFGILEPGRRFKEAFDNWDIPRTLAVRVFELYQSSTGRLHPTFNKYCRAIYARCHHLITGWGWRRCDSMIGTLFDFFASNGLAHLRHEEHHGSPRFLTHLDDNPTLEVEPGDCCFSILLKVIGVGIRALRNVSSEKYVRNIVFRLIPNHGRQYPKERSIDPNDLDALRNNHDLLVTLYWASPPGFRLPIKVIQNLINPETCHREACHVSIRGWTELISFQLSTKEPSKLVDAFAGWHARLTSHVLQQHRSARSEAEAQYQVANSRNDTRFPTAVLEAVVKTNQRQLERVLSDALISLKDALSKAPTREAAMALLNTSSTADVFDIFGTQGPRTHKVIAQALDVVQEYVKIIDRLHMPVGVRNDDSQDYGDTVEFEEAFAGAYKLDAVAHLQTTVHEPLASLLSNAFGADRAPEDALLIPLVDLWVATARLLVEHGLKQWGNYIGGYSHESWASLRYTEQMRKYTPFFLARIVESDKQSYEKHEDIFVSSWIESLVERESMNKFQHRFTSAILSIGQQDPLFANLPFASSENDSRIVISEGEFVERRLSLISCILSNMRDSVEDASILSFSHASYLRGRYVRLLKKLMACMKKNYQDLQQGAATSSSYVCFVQTVVDFLQQHTSEICPIDRFFTDSTTFPLPATDPSYVVGRLKSYGLRLSAPRTHKQLVSFVQSVSERAAVDGQQTYLTNQLCAALSNNFEGGIAGKPTLRTFLSLVVFPAYVELVFSTSTGWILATPVLKASSRMLHDLILDIDAVNIASIQPATTVITTLLETIQQTVGLLVDHSGLLDQPHVCHSLTNLLSVVISSLAPLDYIYRSTRLGQEAIRILHHLHSFSSFVRAILAETPAVSPSGFSLPDCPSSPSVPSSPFADVRNFCVTELRESLRRNWARHDDRYYVNRGNTRSEVLAPLGSLEEEKARLGIALDEFTSSVGEVKALGLWDGSGRERRARRARVGVGVI